ncbi:hypothetical protein ACQF36_22355 [Streptomyces sp. Marseille-Q5077]|uniref:hypothetical protein n=1 Tax=Streptomyces sp. Marseille-Q5077 TaxID=3418995 RepID=UPI003CFFE71B
MSTTPNPPSPNPRQAKGFLVTVALPSTLPASRLRRHDVFALPENSGERLRIESLAPHPQLPTRLVITPVDAPMPITLHVDEPVQPISMHRSVEVTCQLCGASTTTEIDLVAHGEPKTWVCNRH